MAGATEAGLTDSILESPSYILALFFFLFLALSLAFERGVHAASHLCLRQGRPGLAAAVEKLVEELTLLGFVSLLLTSFAGPLSKMCVSYNPAMVGWTMLDNLQGCPCCLSSTQHVSLCAAMAHGCLHNVTSRKPFCDCSVTGSDAYADSGYDWQSFVDSGEIADTCVPYQVNEVVYFAQAATNSLASLSDELGLSRQEICEMMDQNESEMVTGVEDEIFDPDADWEESRRRSRRRLQAGGGSGSDDDAGNPLGFVLKQINSNSTSDTTVHILPRPKLFKCTGPFFSSACPVGQVLLVSATTLHQIHVWLFLIATFHVATSVFQIALSELLVRLLWRRWEQQALQAEAVAASQASNAAKGFPPLESGSLKGMIQGSGSSGLGAQPLAIYDLAGNADMEGGTGSPAAAAASPSCAVAVVAALASGASKLRQRWEFSSGRRPGLHGAALEAGICCVQALSPCIVTRSRFLLMRTAWLAGKGPTSPKATAATTLAAAASAAAVVAAAPPSQAIAPTPEDSHTEVHAELSSSDAALSNRPQRSLGFTAPDVASESGKGAATVTEAEALAAAPDFVQHVLHCLDRDLPFIVGLSLEMGIVLVAMVLLMGALGWAGSLAMLVAITLLFATDIALVAMLRHCCRGGESHPAKHGRRTWWRNPQLLLNIPLRLDTFLCSFIFSTTAFFAWQFGTSSCFFKPPDADSWDFWSLPWWAGLVLASLLLLWTSIATIPAFALVVHTHTRLPMHSRMLQSRDRSTLGSSPSGSHAGPAPAFGQGGGSGMQRVGTLEAAQLMKAEAGRLRARLAQIEASLAAGVCNRSVA